MAVKKKNNRPAPRIEKLNITLKEGFTWRDHEKFMDFLSPRGRILPSTITGLTVKTQRRLATVIKQARHLGLLPFTTQE